MFYTTEEVANLLKVKKETVWGWIRRGKLHAIRPMGKYLVTEEDIHTLIGEKRKSAKGDEHHE